MTSPKLGAPDEELDRWLAELLVAAAPGRCSDFAVVALGSFGRHERCAYSDLDVLLLHDDQPHVADVADALWYPIWDAGFRLDHSVRTVKESIAVAASDLRAAVGLLDARLVAGGERLHRELVDRVRRTWEHRASQWLPALAAAIAERHRQAGEVAFLLEPDLKEGAGGLRDVQLMRAAILARPSLGPLAAEVESGGAVLLKVRDALHRRAGRALDVLLLEQQDGVAADLGYLDADGLMADVAGAGRAIAWHGGSLWQRANRGRMSGRPVMLSPDVELRGGEIDVTAPAASIELVLRAAGHAAELRRPLGLLPPVLPAGDPWPSAARDALVNLLGWGHAAIPVLETLDQTGVLSRLLPEWESVRSRPQRNAYHRFTVDRHLCEAAANAAGLTRTVRRPDLLLIGAWLHDLGKGQPGLDHTDAGVALMATVARRMGFAEADVCTLVTLVRQHLTIAEAATRRDIDDPATVDGVAAAVGSREVLDLLASLTEADGLATGPAAWTAWKAQLVTALVDRVRRRLAGEDLEPRPWTPDCPVQQGVSIGPVVRVVAPDRPGLLADVAGALAASGLEVKAARATSIDGFAIEEFDVEPEMGTWPDPGRVRDRVEAAAAGTLPLLGLLADRMRTYRRHHTARSSRTEVLFDQATDATVVEVRTADSLGLLYRVAAALTGFGLDLVQVRATTMGHEAVDAFYVRGLTAARHDDVRRLIVNAVGTASQP